MAKYLRFSFYHIIGKLHSFFLCNTSVSYLRPSSNKSFSKSTMRCSFILIDSSILYYSFPISPRRSHPFPWLQLQYTHVDKVNSWFFSLAQIYLFYILLDISIWVTHKYQVSYVKDELIILPHKIFCYSLCQKEIPLFT